MIQMDYSWDRGSLRCRQTECHERLAPMLQSTRVQLQHHWTAVRLGSTYHRPHTLQVINVESTDGVSPRHRSTQQFCR